MNDVRMWREEMKKEEGCAYDCDCARIETIKERNYKEDRNRKTEIN